MTTAVDAQLFQAITASTSNFPLKGGYYMVAGSGTWNTNSFELQALGPDGSTFLSFPTALKLSANGMIAGYAPPGLYRFTNSGTGSPTAIYISVAGVPIS